MSHPAEPRPDLQAHPTEPPAGPGRVGRSLVLPAVLVVVTLVAGALWWSRDPAAAPPATPQAAPAPTAGPTMRITAPGTDASAGIGSEKAPAGAASPTGSQPSSAAAAAPTTRRTNKPATTAPAAGAVNTSGRNLALNARVTASSTERSSWAAAYAVDEDAATRWSSQFSDPQWLTVDLGKSWEVSEILLHWENAHATAYRVDVSADGRKWKQVFATTEGQGGDVTVQVPKVPARMIRMYGTKRSTQYGYSLLDVEVR
jgi:eukaryotic-like serine/threonine-protein kinase